MRRMTPAKLLILVDKQWDQLALHEQPIANFACMFYNANRSGGDESKGIPPAEMKAPADFKVFVRKRTKGTLAAKDEGPGGRHNLDGAVADRGRWTAWAHGKSKPVVRKRS